MQKGFEKTCEEIELSEQLVLPFNLPYDSFIA